MRTKAEKAISSMNAEKVRSEEQRKIIERLQEGREKFRKIADINLLAALQLSSLNLELGDKSNKIIRYGRQIGEVGQNIQSDLSSTMNNTSMVTAEHENLSNTLAEVSDNSSHVLESLQENKTVLIDMQNACSTVYDESGIMKSDMAELQKKIDDVKHAVGKINSISNQINLLSLNASVEAARAGSAGKGFGVVAGEIHKLYEATNVMIQEMEMSLENITVASARSVESVNTTAEFLENVNKGMTDVVKRNEESSQDIDQVVENIARVAATSEEISSSINEINHNMEHLGGETRTLLTMTKNLEGLNNALLNKVIQPIQGLEEKLEASTATVGELNKDLFYMLDNKSFINAMNSAIAAHRTWVANLKNIVDTKELAPLQSNPRKCGFGHFYYTITPQRQDIQEIWKSVERPHKELHQLGDEAESAVKTGKTHMLPSIYQRAVQISSMLIEKFNEMVRISKDYDRRGLSVFDRD